MTTDISSGSSFRQTPTGELVAALERLAQADSVESVVETIRQVSRRLVGSDGIAIILRDGDLCHYLEEDAVGPLWKGGKFPMTSCISGWAMMNRRIAVIPDIYKDDRIPHDLYRGTFVRSLVMVPIREHDPVGAIGAYWAQSYEPTIDEVETLISLARASAGAMERLQLIKALSKALEQTELARDELRHRVKNAFVSAQAIGRLSLPPEYAGPLSTRLAALARAHDLLDQRVARDSVISLGALLRTELESYVSSAQGNLEIEGPQVQLVSEEAVALGLAINELATNALKYGALSSSVGKLEVRWRVESRHLLIDWRESNGPQVSTDALDGFGSRLLKRLIEGQLKGTIRRRLDASGVSCVIEIPLEARTGVSASAR